MILLDPLHRALVVDGVLVLIFGNASVVLLAAFSFMPWHIVCSTGVLLAFVVETSLATMEALVVVGCILQEHDEEGSSIAIIY